MLQHLRSTKSFLILLLVITAALSGAAQLGFSDDNKAPIAEGTIPDLMLTTNESGTVDAANYFGDPDGDTLTYTASSANTGVATVSVSGSTVTIGGGGCR